MNREQMIAWLTLEGWVPYAHQRRGCTFTLSQDGISGIYLDEACSDANNNWVCVFGDEVAHTLSDLPEKALIQAYTMVQEKDHEPR